MLQVVCAFALPRDFTCEISKEKENSAPVISDVHEGNEKHGEAEILM